MEHCIGLTSSGLAEYAHVEPVFISQRERIQDFTVIDYTKEMIILAVISDGPKEEAIGIGQYAINSNFYSAEVAFAVKDEYHNKGISTELLSYLTHLAKKQGLLGFTAEVLVENRPMLHVFEKMGFEMDKKVVDSVYELRMRF